METSFGQALAFTLRWEGGYVDNPQDPGGETNFGISKRAYPHLNIKELTKEQAGEIYHRDYWAKAGCPEIAYPLDIVVFDTAVNVGVSRALDFLKVTHDVESYLLLRLKFYISLNIAKTFIFGWTRRVISLWNEARGLT
jgi:lysozyme family protein